MASHPTALWQAIGDGTTFYRRQQLYSLPGKLPDLGDYIVAACQYGGPLGE
jgi:vacuolar protein sorting-associated protein 16